MMGQAPGRKDERPPLSEHSLAPYGNRVIRPPEDAQRTNRKRLISWLLVALVHGFFIALLTANFIKQEKVGEKGPIETFFDLSVMHNPSLAPPVTMIKPEVENANPPEVSTAPITIPKVKPVPPEEVPPAASPPGDVLKSIGEALACGASNFENLTEAQRARCRHQPWIARQLPNGNIVMDMPPQPAQPPEIHMSGADAQRHEMQTSPGCPIMLQTPCVDDILHGRSAKPF